MGIGCSDFDALSEKHWFAGCVQSEVSGYGMAQFSSAGRLEAVTIVRNRQPELRLVVENPTEYDQCKDIHEPLRLIYAGILSREAEQYSIELETLFTRDVEGRMVLCRN